jgi:hypothetical protein
VPEPCHTQRLPHDEALPSGAPAPSSTGGPTTGSGHGDRRSRRAHPGCEQNHEACVIVKSTETAIFPDRTGVMVRTSNPHRVRRLASCGIKKVICLPGLSGPGCQVPIRPANHDANTAGHARATVIAITKAAAAQTMATALEAPRTSPTAAPSPIATNGRHTCATIAG